MPTQGTDWDDGVYSVYSYNSELLGRIETKGRHPYSVGSDPGRPDQPLVDVAISWEGTTNFALLA